MSWTFPAGFYAGGKSDEEIATHRPNVVAMREQGEAECLRL